MPRVKVPISKDEDQLQDEAQTNGQVPTDDASADNPNETDETSPSTNETSNAKDGGAEHKVVAIPKQIAYLLMAIVVLLVILIVVAVVRKPAPKDSVNTSGQTSDEQPSSDKIAQEYTDQIRAYLNIPEGKPLEYAEVKDADKLRAKNPTIFRSSADGDVVLFYANADKSLQVVLYRPSTKKVITYIDGINQNQTNTTKQ